MSVVITVKFVLLWMDLISVVIVSYLPFKISVAAFSLLNSFDLLVIMLKDGLLSGRSHFLSLVELAVPCHIKVQVLIDSCTQMC